MSCIAKQISTFHTYLQHGGGDGGGGHLLEVAPPALLRALLEAAARLRPLRLSLLVLGGLVRLLVVVALPAERVDQGRQRRRRRADLMQAVLDQQATQ